MWKSPSLLSLTFPVGKWSEFKGDEAKVSRVFHTYPFRMQIQVSRHPDSISSGEEILMAELWWGQNDSGALPRVEVTAMILHHQTRQPLLQASSSVAVLSGERRMVMKTTFKLADVSALSGSSASGDHITIRYELKGLPC